MRKDSKSWDWSHGSHKPMKCRGQQSSPWLQKNHTLMTRSYAQVVSCRGREMHAVTFATGPWLTSARFTISRLTFCKTLTDTSIKSFATRLVISLKGGTGIVSPPYSSCSISTRWGMKIYYYNFSCFWLVLQFTLSCYCVSCKLKLQEDTQTHSQLPLLGSGEGLGTIQSSCILHAWEITHTSTI